MADILFSRAFRIHVYIMSILMLLAAPAFSIAQDRSDEFQGHYSNELKIKVDKTYSRISKNLENYRKVKSVEYLDEALVLINKSVDEMDGYLEAATRRVQEIPESNSLGKLNAQVDKLEVINIRDVQLPYLCNQLYEVGRNYIKVDKVKAKQCFEDILDRFSSFQSRNCRDKAESSLDRME